MEFLTRAGHITDDVRQELILLSDTLGASPIGEKDSVFGVKESLIKDFAQQPAGTATPDGREVDGTWSRVRFDIVLAPATS